MLFLDTETCGLVGPIVLIQYAVDEGEVVLYSPWKQTAQETMDLIEWIVQQDIVGFNLAFDWFHICQFYTTLALLTNKKKTLQDCIEEYKKMEPLARDGDCLKPHGCLDLMLHARKGPYQNTLNRDDVVIKRIPTPIAYDLAAELTARIPINDVYFARKQDKSIRWQVVDIEDCTDFKNVVLRFAPSSALKALAVDALGLDVTKYSDISLPDWAQPQEYEYAPFAQAVYAAGDYKAWPEVIKEHIVHWHYNQMARAYAKNDVVFTRALYHYFNDPPMSDTDSILACMVGAVRWKGFAIDEAKIRDLKAEAEYTIKGLGFNFNSVAVVRKYLSEVMTDIEQIAIADSTKAIILEEIAKWEQEDGFTDMHPAAMRAQEILNARHAKKSVEVFDKLLLAGRLHASLVIIGTRSSRMSGSGGLNVQGIKRDKNVRAAFPLASAPNHLAGGDFISFEVTLADAVYKDPVLREELLSGKSVHAMFGEFLFDTDYDSVVANKDLYTRAKQCVFALLYGGTEYTLSTRGGIPEEKANEAYQKWINKYRQWGIERRKVFDLFCSMRQKGGIGTRVEWHEPQEYIENMFGFRRYFTLENQICKALYALANKPLDKWKEIKGTVRRRDRDQTQMGATQSALYAAAFALQAANMRAAANHVIQSSGAQITKELQRRLWDLQPVGINPWVIQSLNVHDEIMCVTTIPLKHVVDAFIQEYKEIVPLIGIGWKENLTTWADK